ncbi:MAG: hypothetical protein ABID54_14200 [Pseudomonadota bacterium]
MKIISPDISKIVGSQENQKGDKHLDKKFNDVLQEAIERASTSKDQPLISPPVNNVSPVPCNWLSPAAKIPIVDRVEKFLDVLEDYQRKLGNPKISLEDLNPLITRMENETRNLLPLLDSFPKGDGMRDILNRALIASTVEAMKFKRGDYLASSSVR